MSSQAIGEQLFNGAKKISEGVSKYATSPEGVRIRDRLAGGLNVAKDFVKPKTDETLQDTDNTPKSKQGQDVNIGKLMEQFNNLRSKKEHTSNPQDADNTDINEQITTHETPQEAQLAKLKEQEKQIKLQQKIDAQTIKNYQVQVDGEQKIMDAGTKSLKQMINNGVMSEMQAMEAKRKQQKASLEQSISQSGQQQQQPQQQPYPQYNPQYQDPNQCQPSNNYSF